MHEYLDKQKRQVETFLNETLDARRKSERDRDYYDGKQWTDEQVATLRQRNQAPIVVNRIKPKVEGLKGLVSIRRTDPKAFPRNNKDEKAENTAHAVTDGLRFVADNNDFIDKVKMPVAEDFFIEGYGAAIIDVRQNPREIEIRIKRIPWDRFYFDPHSREKDFSDARYMGQVIWMSADEVKELFPDVDVAALMMAATGDMDETFEDRPKWVDTRKNRVRVAQHFYKSGGKWYMSIFAGDMFLVKGDLSPFLDEYGEPSNPIEALSAYVDRNNERYGEVRGFIDQQNEINHRRSKALHLLSTRQTASRKGAIKDVDELKRELAKPNGHIEYAGEKGDFEILGTGDMAAGQFELYQDAKAELDAVSFNAQLSGERQDGDLSGRAIEKLQSAGAMELNGLFSQLSQWEKRIYRQIWARIKQFWDEEKWIRVTDDYDNLKWVGLNAQVTAKEWMEEQINDEALPPMRRQQVAASYQFLINAAQNPDPFIAQQAQAKLQMPVEIRNEVSELDVDIILDQSFDTVNVQQEQFQLLANFAQNSDIDIIELIELSAIRGKDALIEKIEQRRAQAAQAQGNIQQIQAMDAQAKMRKTNAEAINKEQEAIQKRIQNQILVTQPVDPDPQVVA